MACFSVLGLLQCTLKQAKYLGILVACNVHGRHSKGKGKGIRARPNSPFPNLRSGLIFNSGSHTFSLTASSKIGPDPNSFTFVVSGSLFVSPCPPECKFQSKTKIEPDLRLLFPFPSYITTATQVGNSCKLT